ncbi:MAG: hypothetical protein EBZ47_03735 [Chlamydiae bacterium]|nr:hypothetical protein [Chlamydiota bacterium]
MSLVKDFTKFRKVAKIILAASVKETFPQAKLKGGGVTPMAFYYDFCFPFDFQAPLLTLIEEGMHRIIKDSLPIEMLEMVPFSASEMLSHFQEEVLSAQVLHTEDSLVKIAKIGSFLDWVQEEDDASSTCEAGVIKLKTFEKVGPFQGESVVRIWGVAASNKQELKIYLKQESFLLKRMHQQLGKEGGWFLCDGPINIFYPKGERLMHDLSLLLRDEVAKNGFPFVSGPASYVVNVLEGEDADCLCSSLLTKRAEIYRNLGLIKCAEDSIFLKPDLNDFSSGLLQTVQSSVDIQYMFCSEKQVFHECISSLQFMSKMLKILGFEFKVVLSTRKVKSSALNKLEKICIEALKKAVLALGEHEVVEKFHPHFQGAKIEFKVKDLLGRDWATGFMQVGLNEKQDGILLARSTLGSKERFIALLLEKYNELPFLLQDKSIKVLALDDAVLGYAYEVLGRVQSEGIRSEIESLKMTQNDNLQKRLLEKNLFLLIVGSEEKNNATVKVRVSGAEHPEILPLDELILRLKRYKELE